MRFELSQDLVARSVGVAGAELKLAFLPDFGAAVARIEAAVRSEDGLLPDDVIPYYCAVWPAAELLAREVVKALDNLDPKQLKVLELGSGLGIPALVAAGRGCCVTAVDANSDALELLDHNAARNNLSMELIHSDWRKLPEVFPPGSFDLILASDVLYEPYHGESFAKVSRYLLASEGKILLTDPCRWHYQDFIHSLERESFNVEVRFEDAYDEIGRSRNVIAIATRLSNLDD